MRSRQSLVREADRVFSLYVRNRGSTFGYNHCFVCGVYLPIESLQAGHFVPRRFFNTRWHPFNVWPECNRCNIELNGNLKLYEKKLAARYSQDAIDGLWCLARSNEKVTDDDIREIIKSTNNYLRLNECYV